MIQLYKSDLFDFTVTPSLKELNHYQVTVFDRLGPVSDRQCKSWDEVAQRLHEDLASPAQSSEMRFIN